MVWNGTSVGKVPFLGLLGMQHQCEEVLSIRSRCMEACREYVFDVVLRPALRGNEAFVSLHV